MNAAIEVFVTSVPRAAAKDCFYYEEMKTDLWHAHFMLCLIFECFCQILFGKALSFENRLHFHLKSIFATLKTFFLQNTKYTQCTGNTNKLSKCQLTFWLFTMSSLLKLMSFHSMVLTLIMHKVKLCISFIME